MKRTYAKVIVDVPAQAVDRLYTYAVPAHMAVVAGVRVVVPFGPRTVTAIVRAVEADSEVAKVREIREVLDTEPIVSMQMFRLAEWIAREYACTMAVVLSTIVPRALKAIAQERLTVSDQARAWIEDPFSVHIDAFTEHEAHTAACIVRTVAVHEPMERSVLLAHQDVSHIVQLHAWVRRGIAAGWLVASMDTHDRVRVKKETIVVPLHDAAALSELAQQTRVRSPKQAAVLDVLAGAADGMPWRKRDIEGACPASSSALRALAHKGVVRLDVREVWRDPYDSVHVEASAPPLLTDDQRNAVQTISIAVQRHDPEVFLLHGVTGSGKTEVYLHAIEACMMSGREAILLIPEISLTPQMVRAFKARFGDRVAVLHSHLSPGEKYDEWRKIATRRVCIAIGARSAIFAPFLNVGLIIVDEEHESSYKQEDAPKYNARDVAIKRGELHSAPVVLGSATPSLETYARALRNARTHITMHERINNRCLPPVEVIDMRKELQQGNRSMFSRALKQSLHDTLQKKEQAMLFLNRRGYANFVLCRDCGYVPMCPHCDVTLTDHRVDRQLRCHYCGHHQPTIDVCPHCAGDRVRHFGSGTQQVEEQLRTLFPDVRALRMDVDTTSQKGAHERLLSQFRERKADVLIGTQMIAKGLDFPALTLVGVMSADTALRLPDFRAAEKTFQLLTQVAGRAGRHALEGHVIVQTYAPEHYSIAYAAKHDYDAFARTELAVRADLGYPPYRRIALVTVSGPDVADAMRTSEAFAYALREAIANTPHIALLGPVPSPIPKIKDRYRFQLLVKAPHDTAIAPMLKAVVAAHAEEAHKRDVQMHIDIDPHMLG
jgi:primosomal protein N' (replication factor Y)